MLRSLEKSDVANNIGIVSSQVQQAISSAAQGAGTIVLGAPTVAPASQSLGDRIKWLASLLTAAGVDPSKIPTLVAISLAENGSSNPNATSSTSDSGLWQINVPTWTQALITAGIISSSEDLKDPLKNAKAAAYVLQHQGLEAWVTFQQGLHNTWIGQVQEALAGIDLGGGQATPTPQPGGNTNPCNCPNVTYGPVTMPEIGCVIQCAFSSLIGSWKQKWIEWWDSWTKAHAANWAFVMVGVVLVVVSVSALIMENKQVQRAAAAVASRGASEA